MTDINELRRLLDERGVEWNATDTYRLLVTSWNDASGHSWAFMEHRDGNFSKLTAYHLTPEQAIAATLGPKVCHMKETVYPFSDKDEYWMVCSECGFSIYMRRGWQPLRYCSHCGARIVEVDE
jgi:hypothetical protein